MANFDIKYIPMHQTAIDAFAEPEVEYIVKRPDMTMAAFESIAAQFGFTQQEWAAILHISDRTLQRYLKGGKAFTGMQAEVLFYLQKLLDAGKQLFQNMAGFISWLRVSKNVLGRSLSFDSLQSISGIKLLHDELGRMAYGVYI